MLYLALLFIALSPGVLVTIPQIGNKMFMSGKTSLTAAFVHAVVFYLVLLVLEQTGRSVSGFASGTGYATGGTGFASGTGYSTGGNSFGTGGNSPGNTGSGTGGNFFTNLWNWFTSGSNKCVAAKRLENTTIQKLCGVSGDICVKLTGAERAKCVDTINKCRSKSKKNEDTFRFVNENVNRNCGI